MNKPALLVGLAALALITTPVAAQKSPEAVAEVAKHGRTDGAGEEAGFACSSAAEAESPA